MATGITDPVDLRYFYGPWPPGLPGARPATPEPLRAVALPGRPARVCRRGAPGNGGRRAAARAVRAGGSPRRAVSAGGAGGHRLLACGSRHLVRRAGRRRRWRPAPSPPPPCLWRRRRPPDAPGPGGARRHPSHPKHQPGTVAARLQRAPRYAARETGDRRSATAGTRRRPERPGTGAWSLPAGAADPCRRGASRSGAPPRPFSGSGPWSRRCPAGKSRPGDR